MLFINVYCWALIYTVLRSYEEASSVWGFLKKWSRRCSRSSRGRFWRLSPVRFCTCQFLALSKQLTLPAASKVPMRVAIPAQAPMAMGRERALTPAVNPAAQPPAAPLAQSSVCELVLEPLPVIAPDGCWRQRTG